MSPQCGAAEGGRQAGRVRPISPRPGRLPRAVHHRAWHLCGRRLLRHHARAPARSHRSLRAPRPCCSHSRCRTLHHIHLQPGNASAGQCLFDDLRAHQRQRFKEIPRADGRRRLGRLHADGPPRSRRRSARRGSLRRLCRARRHQRHGRTSPPFRHRRGRPARAGFHRT